MSDLELDSAGLPASSSNAMVEVRDVDGVPDGRVSCLDYGNVDIFQIIQGCDPIMTPPGEDDSANGGIKQELPSADAGCANGGGIVAEAANEPTRTFTPGTFRISLEPTKGTKQLAEEEYGYRIKKDASLKIKLEAKGFPTNGKYDLQLLVNYKNPAYEYPVTPQNEELKRADQVESQAVFTLTRGGSGNGLTNGVTFSKSGRGDVIGQVSNINLAEDNHVFILFKEPSSLVKQGDGWILTAILSNNGYQLAEHSFEIKCLTIIRSGEKRPIIYNYPSPPYSEQGDDNDSGEWATMTMTELGEVERNLDMEESAVRIKRARLNKEYRRRALEQN